MNEIKRLKTAIYVFLGIITAILCTFAGFFIWVFAQNTEARHRAIYGASGTFTVQEADAENCPLKDFILDISWERSPNTLGSYKILTATCSVNGEETAIEVEFVSCRNQTLKLKLTVGEKMYKFTGKIKKEKTSYQYFIETTLSSGKEKSKFVLRKP